MRLAAALLALCCALSAVAAEPGQKRPSIPVGSVPFDELGKDINGQQMLISDHRGKVVILSFWATWCEPCRKELPVLAGIVKSVGPEHLKVIAINYHDEPKPFKEVVRILREFPIAILRDASGKAARKFQVNAIPRMIVIGRDGKVAADHTGYGEGALPGLIKELNALLAQET